MTAEKAHKPQRRRVILLKLLFFSFFSFSLFGFVLQINLAYDSFERTLKGLIISYQRDEMRSPHSLFGLLHAVGYFRPYYKKEQQSDLSAVTRSAFI